MSRSLGSVALARLSQIPPQDGVAPKLRNIRNEIGRKDYFSSSYVFAPNRVKTALYPPSIENDLATEEVRDGRGEIG